MLVFAWFYLPFVGGAELFLRAITERLRDRFDFVIVTVRLRRRELSPTSSRRATQTGADVGNEASGGPISPTADCARISGETSW